MTPLAFHRQFWKGTRGDSEKAIARAESRLKVALPAVLREFYGGTDLRSSQQLHLRPLKELEVENGRVIFSEEQQGCFSWSLRIDQLRENDPAVWLYGNDGDCAEGCRLSDWLNAFTLINRPYEPPCSQDYGGDAEKLLEAGWTQHPMQWHTIQITMFTFGDAACDGVCYGARTSKGLKEALKSVGITATDDDLHLPE
ncbi:MAG: SMI1/KNR4 family protein [Deltaproteobacteria bacterium]|nr:SMI1/KNR4 family protein [Deltaproteobacteria bacterium]